MVMSPIRPRFAPQGGFVCSTPLRPSRNSVFYSSLMLSPIFDEGEVPSRQKIPRPFRASSRQDHGIGQKRSSLNKVAAAAASAAAATNVGDVASGQKVVMHPPSTDRRKEPDTDYREEEKSPVQNRSRTITIEYHQEKAGERMRNSSERIWQNVVASADPQSSVILGNPHKKQVHKTYQKDTKAKRRIDAGKYVSLNILKRKEEEEEEEERLQRKGTFDNSNEPKGGKEVHEEMRSPQKKQTLQNIIERINESPHRKQLSANSEKSSGKEDQELETIDPFDNIVIPKNNNVQPEATRSPQKKETLQNREKRKEKQQVVRERLQRKRLSRNSEKSSKEEEQESVSESLGEKDLVCNDTSQKETMQNSMDRNEKQEVVQQRTLRKQSAPDGVKSNTDEKTGEASDSSKERKQQVISKIPRRKGVPQNCQSSKQKENSQAAGESPQKERTSQNAIHSKMKKDPRPMRRSPRKKSASPDKMLSKGKDPLALVESQKKQVPQNRIIRSRRKEEIISLEKQASQGSRRHEGRNESRIEDKTSQLSEEVIKPKSKKKPLPVPEGHVSKQNRITRSRRKEETLFSEKQASQGSRRHGGRNESQTEDKTSQPSEELTKSKSKKKTVPEGHVPKSKRKKVVQEPSQRKEESWNNSKRNTKPQMSYAEKENVPLPRSSARGDKTNSFNTSSTSTLKSSHPTYKTVRKRRQHAVESLAKYLALGRLSTEYNPFRNGQKLIVPSEDDGNLRRSKRTRVKPLDYWRGERCLYKPTNHGPDFFRISSPS